MIDLSLTNRKVKSNLQVDVYLMFIRIRNDIKSLEITISKSLVNPRLLQIIRSYSKMQ
jgi:hypothetical protein